MLCVLKYDPQPVEGEERPLRTRVFRLERRKLLFLKRVPAVGQLIAERRGKHCTRAISASCHLVEDSNGTSQTHMCNRQKLTILIELFAEYPSTG